MTGGSEKATYYISGRYNGQDGLFRYNSDDYHIYNLTAKGTIDVTDWFSITDAEWPRIRAAFEAWLDPANFSADGRQKRRLSDLRG